MSTQKAGDSSQAGKVERALQIWVWWWSYIFTLVESYQFLYQMREMWGNSESDAWSAVIMTLLPANWYSLGITARAANCGPSCDWWWKAAHLLWQGSMTRQGWLAIAVFLVLTKFLTCCQTAAEQSKELDLTCTIMSDSIGLARAIGMGFLVS